MIQTEIVVLVEGYHDRSFWSGLLTSYCCEDLFSAGRIVQDPWGARVTKGQFGFRSPGGLFVRVIPCDANSEVRKHAKRRLRERNTKALTSLVVSIDADDAEPEDLRASYLALARELDASAQSTAAGDVVLDGGATTLGLVIWHLDDGFAAPGVPTAQTLERVVCSALAATYPARGQSVEDWLSGRPEPPPEPFDAKAYAWAFMAGWHCGDG